MKKKLVVYLLSYNRPEFIIDAIDSILSQTFSDFDFIISENSSNESVHSIIEKYRNNSRVQIIQRNPSLTALNHFNVILQECQNYEYAMLFHDDDVLLPNALSIMMAEFEKNQNLSAVSCNAFVLRNDLMDEKLFNPNLIQNKTLQTKTELIQGYLNKKTGHTPFPAYIYNMKKISGLQFDSKNGGKYSDVSFLVELISSGPFAWFSQPLMKYRIHSSNDSANIAFVDLIRISLFFVKNAPALIFYILIYLIKNCIKKCLKLVI